MPLSGWVLNTLTHLDIQTLSPKRELLLRRFLSENSVTITPSQEIEVEGCGLSEACEKLKYCAKQIAWIVDMYPNSIVKRRVKAMADER